MKQLVFHIGADRYGLRLGQVVRVLPLMELKQLPQAPPQVAGLMDFHGRPVPVIDLCRLSTSTPARRHYDSRIIVVDYHDGDGRPHLLGLLAERVQGVRQVDQAALAASGVRAAPFLGAVASDPDGMLQLVELEQLLAPPLRALLFPPEAP